MRNRFFLLTAMFILLFAAPVSSQNNIRVSCRSFTMNVPSENVHCYQIEDNIPVTDGASPEEIARAQIASTSIYISDFLVSGSVIEPQVTFYLLDDLAKTSFSLLDPAMRLSEMISNLQAGDITADSLNEEIPFLPFQAEPITIQALPALISCINGTGLRTVTAFQEQIKSNGNESNLYYSWQGLSDDGKYYISAVFPLRSVSLDGKSVSSVEWNESVLSDLLPSLDQLDYYISSIVIE